MRCIYVIRNLVNGKVYVGQTKDFARRKTNHLYCARKGLKRPLYDSIRKHGEENFLFEVLEECEPEVTNEREQYWVSHYDSFNSEKGYNLTSGGKQHFDFSKEVRQKLSESHKGLPRTQEHCENISKAKRGKSSGWEGRKQTPEHISNRVASYKASLHYHKKKGFPKRFSVEQVEVVIARLMQGVKIQDLAVELGVCRGLIRKMKQRKYFK